LKRNKIILALLVVVTGFSVSSAGVTDSLFRSANAAYDDKDFESALAQYQELENRNYRSAALYFNIGNCHFKAGRPGYAILYYLRAKKLDPYDEDINANLEFARQFMPTRLEGVSINPVTTFLSMLVRPLTLNGFAWLSSILFIVLILFWAVRILFQRHELPLRIVTYLLVVLVVVSFGMTTYKYRTEYLTSRGVIVADETRIYSGPGEDNDVEFVGSFGLVFEIERDTDDFYLVIFENNRKGWIKKDQVGII